MTLAQLVLIEQFLSDEIVESGVIETVSIINFQQKLAHRSYALFVNLPLLRADNLT